MQLLISGPRSSFISSQCHVSLSLQLLICLGFLVETTMISKLMRAIIMGPPGSGKGTISTRIVKDFEIQHLSSGDLLRSQIRQKTAAGLEAKRYIEKGQLVPDTVMVDLILGDLKTINDKSWLLDGFPRTVSQAEALYAKEPVDAVINLDVSFEVIIDRIKGRWVHAPSGRIYHTEFNPPKVPGLDDETGQPLTQRDDDKEETVLRRLTAYQNQTQPVLDYYRKLGLLEEFQGNYSNELWPKVHRFLATKMTPSAYTHYD